MEDEFNLERFLIAQTKFFQIAVDELKKGQKKTHWIWFIFPQVEGIGSSKISKRFAIESIEEAREYLKHPILGPRLCECTQLVLNVSGRSISDIFGHPDDKKFLACMTLFNKAASPENKSHHVFNEALVKFFHGLSDQITMEYL